MSTCSSSVRHYRSYDRDYRNYRMRKLLRQLCSYLLLFLMIFGSMGWFFWDWNQANSRVEELVFQPQIVQSGDTLWSLAENSGLQIDTRTLVLKIMEYNKLTDTTIQTGQVIYTPISENQP
ncbi:MAG TPA: LysM peptidoglycan-binding domain-containing protein [Desulfitobacterium dehalogenans]|uniref:LysM peptidoglycan-binding domain-containing protein n=1 Tax=Desulfitobacterium dehalogenans TaxID=36854 RepID=A0A7C6Z338_9FIRM|nr:LysM peptidoglycan-binding domain-containing protein [Desulfitobacterium dehalogenans]